MLECGNPQGNFMVHILKKTLSDLGLDKKKSAVLVALLHYGPQSGREVAKAARIERTTTYGILKNLVAKGFVSSSSEKGALMFQSLEPEALIDYIERIRLNLDERKKEIKAALPELKSLRKKRDIFPRVHFFEGRAGIKQAYEDALKNNREKVILEFAGAEALFKLMGREWADHFVDKRVRLGIACRAIAPDADWGRYAKNLDAKTNRVTKLIPEKYRFDIAIDIYDNKVALFSFSKEEPVAVIIEDDTIANAVRTLFEYVSDTVPEGQPHKTSQV